MTDKRCIAVADGVVTAIYVCGCPDQSKCPLAACGDVGQDCGIGWTRTSDGSFSAPAAPATVSMTEVTKRQFMLQAKVAGLWPTITAALAANQDASDEFNMSTVIDRSYALVNTMASVLGIDAATMDAFFDAASLL